jgi:predicted O-methyltransferase YrrM
MNKTLKHLIDKYDLDVDRKPPIEISHKSREDMTRVLAELGFKRGAEIGVAQGNHAELLCRNNPGLKLYCVDIWDPYKGYNEYTNRINRYYELAKEKLEPYNCTFIKKFSMDAVRDFEDGSLDFVYIDAAHDFKSVACDIYEWTKRVKVGGIVYGHDYKRWRKGEARHVVEVKDIVQAYCYVKAINPWFVLKIPRQRSWMFVRQEKDKI